MHGKLQLPFLTTLGSSFFSVQSLLHVTVIPSTVRSWPSVAKHYTHIHHVKLSLPLEVYIPLVIFLLNTRTENSS